MSSLITPSYKQGFYAPGRGGVALRPELWDGCIGAWNPGLGPTGSQLRDVSVKKNHGTLTAMDAATDWVLDEKGYSLDFNGTDKYVALTQQGTDYVGTSTTSDTPFSFSAWMRARTSAVFQPIISSETFGVLNDTFFLGTTGTGAVGCLIYDSGGADRIGRSGPVLSTDTWYHVCVTYDGSGVESGITLYLDGVECTDSQTNGTYVAAAPASLVIGTRFLGGPSAQWFNGQITDVRGYNRVLDFREVKELGVRPGIAYERKRRFYYSLPAIPTTGLFSTGGSFLISDRSSPSYKQGFYAPGRGGVAAHPELWNGCVGAWNPGLGSTGLVLKDWSNGGRDGAVENMAASDVWGVTSGYYSASLDGVDGHRISLPSMLPITVDDFSLSMWIYPVENANANTFWFCQREQGGSLVGFMFWTEDDPADNTTQVLVDNGPTLSTGNSNTSLPYNKWSHVTITVVRSGLLTFYYNGLPDGTLDVSASAGDLSSITTPLTVGFGGDWTASSSSVPTGAFSDAMVHNRILTPNEIKTLSLRPGIAYERKRRIYFASTAAATNRRRRLLIGN